MDAERADRDQTTIVIADDHTVVRQGLRLLIDNEVEVLRLIALGHTNTEMAQQLLLSTRTVETHRAHIQHKLRRTSRAELVRYALEHGLVET